MCRCMHCPLCTTGCCRRCTHPVLRMQHSQHLRLPSLHARLLRSPRRLQRQTLVKTSAVHPRHLVTALLMASFSWAAALQYSGRNQRSARLGIAVQSIVVLLGFWRAPAGVIMHERPLACWCWRRRSACCCCWLWCCAALAAPCMDSLVWPTCVKSGADDEANLHSRVWWFDDVGMP